MTLGDIILIVICSLLMLIGFFGIFLPLIPGVPLVWLGILIYAIGTGFREISVLAVVMLFILMALTLLLDFAAPLFGLKKYRASGWSYLGSVLGFFIGLVTLGIWGIIIGPIAGAFVAELIAKREIRYGLRAALATVLGSIFGTILKTIAALIMIGYFILSFFR